MRKMTKRKIPLKHSSLSGYKHSEKSTKKISYESSLEADFIDVLEWDSRIKFYEEQPVTIQYLNENKQLRKYTPDFLVEFHDKPNSDLPINVPIIYEVKYSDELIRKMAEFEPKFNAAKAYCKSEGFEFKVITEIEIRNEYLENIKFLKRFKRGQIHLPMKDYLKTQLSKFEITTPEILIASSSQIEEKKAMLLHALWVLIANGVISVDLTKKITMNSKIWLPKL